MKNNMNTLSRRQKVLDYKFSQIKTPITFPVTTLKSIIIKIASIAIPIIVIFLTLVCFVLGLITTAQNQEIEAKNYCKTSQAYNKPTCN